MSVSDPNQNTFNISNSQVTNLTGSGDIHAGPVSERSLDSRTGGRLSSLANPDKTILFLAADPVSTSQLRLDREVRDIEAGLQRSQHRDRFQLKQQWAVRPRDLQRSLLDHSPQIVHFSGHGVGEATNTQTADPPSIKDARKITFAGDQPDAPMASEEGIILEGISGEAKLVSTEALASLFSLFAQSVECVVLNACYSQRQATAIAQHIPYVIGMNQAIGDRAAIEFAVGFYDALGAGRSVEFAYKLGCSAIQLAGIAEHLTPVLLPKANAS